MATKNNIYRSGYSMEYGTFVGLGWGMLFLSYVGGICTGNAALMLLCLALCGICLIMPFGFALRLNKKLYAIEEKLSYWQGYWFSLVMFMYAGLMNGLIVFAYFHFFDGGALYEQLHSLLTQSEIARTYQQIGMGEQYAQITSMLDEINELSAFEKALAIFNNNCFYSFIMSFFVAIAASYAIKPQNKGMQQ